MVNRVSTILLLLIACLGFTPGVWAAKITVSIDRNPVSIDESFTLEYVSTESVDDDPNFAPLEKNFQILSQSKSQNIQFINGQVSRQSRWTLTVIARQVGQFLVPRISFGSDESNSLQLTVSASSSSSVAKSGPKEIKLELEVDTQEPYVQAQIILTLRIYQGVNLRNLSLSRLNLSEQDSVVEELGDEVIYEKRINGVRFKVIEKRYAIFPQKSGELVIEPMVLEAQIVDRRRFLRTKRYRSNQLRIMVKSKPSLPATKSTHSLLNKNWLPAKKLQLKEDWPKGQTEFNVGESITRTVTLAASGLTYAQLPSLSGTKIENIKQYPDQPILENRRSNQGITGIRQEKLALIPSRAGKVILPAIEIPWWDTINNKMRVAKLAQRVLTVVDAAGNKSDAISGNTFSHELPAASIDKNEKDPQPSLREDDGSQGAKIWFWLSILFLLGWAATIAAWWFSRRQLHEKSSSDGLNSVTGYKKQLSKVKAACTNNNAASVKSTLLEWARQYWPDKPPMNLNEIRRRCNDKLLDAEIERLNAILYSQQGENWQGQPLWQALEKFVSNIQEDSGETDDVIAPLFLSMNNK